MCARVLWLPLAVGLAVGAQPEPVVVPILVYTGFQHQPAASVSDTIRTEVETILGHSGIEFGWRSLGDAIPNEDAAELAVIQLKGRCDIAGMLPQHHDLAAWVGLMSATAPSCPTATSIAIAFGYSFKWGCWACPPGSASRPMAAR